MPAENVLAMTLRMRNTATTTARNLRTEVNKVGTSATKMGTKFGKSVKATRTSVAGLAGSMISLKTIIVATFAFRALQKFGRFLSSLTKLFSEQEVATRKLAQSMAGYGTYTKEGVKSLQAYAERLQYIVAIDNEAIEAQMGLLAAYGMTANEIKSAILPAIDLSVARQIELKAAVDLIGKAFIGYTGTLSRYGIILEKGLNREEKYEAAMKELAKATGVAAGVAETYTGKLFMVGAAWRDTKKWLGAIIADSLMYSGVLDNLITQFGVWENYLKTMRPALGWISSVGLKGIVDTLRDISDAVTSDDFIAWIITMKEGAVIIGNAFQILFRRIRLGFEYSILSLGVMKEASLALHHVMNQDLLKAGIHTREAMRLNKELWDFVDATSKKAEKQTERDSKELTASIDRIADAWKRAAEGTLWESITKRLKAINEELRKKGNLIKDNIRNQQQANLETEKAFELTQAMARSYALASRLEQAQVRHMMRRLPGMEVEDIGGLSEMERKLISRQGILKEQFTKLLGEYAEQELGIKTDFLKGMKTKVEIDLTDRAEEILRVSKVETTRQGDSAYERLAG